MRSVVHHARSSSLKIVQQAAQAAQTQGSIGWRFFVEDNQSNSSLGDLRLPTDLLVYVLSFLDARSLALLSRTNSQMLTLCSNPRLWEARKAADFGLKRFVRRLSMGSILRSNLDPQFAIHSIEHPKDEYMRLMKKKKSIHKQHKSDIIKLNRSNLCNLVQELSPVCFVPFLVLVFLILLSISLGINEKLPLQWWVFIPLFILMAIFTSFTIWGCYIWIRKTNVLYSHDDIEDSFGCVPMCIACTVDPGTHNPATYISLFMFLNAIISIFLLIFKTMGSINISYVHCMIPLCILTATQVTLPFTKCDICGGEGLGLSGRIYLYLCTQVFFVLPVFLSMLFLALRLDGIIQTHISIIFIGLFFTQGTLSLLSCLAGRLSFLFYFFLCSAPILIFQILLSVRNWNESPSFSIPVLFIPLYIMFLFWSCIGCVASMGFNELYRDRYRQIPLHSVDEDVENIPVDMIQDTTNLVI